MPGAVSVLSRGHDIPPLTVPFDGAPKRNLHSVIKDNLVQINLSLAWKFGPTGPDGGENDALAIGLVEVRLEMLCASAVDCFLGWVEGNPLSVSPLV